MTKSSRIILFALCLLSLELNATSLYLVRHGEKQDVGADPALTACGQARAKALAVVLADIALAAVYSTGYQRTLQTATAVAQSQQLKVSLYDARDADSLIAQLRQYQQPVLIVGHSNTIPQLVSYLSGFNIAPLTEQDYNMLYQVELTDNATVTLRRQTFQCEQETALPELAKDEANLK
jgi:broad specificity phosphatase PhoE